MPYSQENISAYLHTIKEMAKYLPRPTLLNQTEPKDSDSDSVTSTILTDSQIKRSKTDPVRPFITNDGFHLVTSSKTQPKIATTTLAPPHPPRYPYPVICKNLPGHYNEEENDPSPKPPVRSSGHQHKRYDIPQNEALAAGADHQKSNDTRELVPPTPAAQASSLRTKVTSISPTENSNKYQEEDYDEDISIAL